MLTYYNMNENRRSKKKMQISGSQGISQINMFSGLTLEATAALEWTEQTSRLAVLCWRAYKIFD